MIGFQALALRDQANVFWLTQWYRSSLTVLMVGGLNMPFNRSALTWPFRTAARLAHMSETVDDLVENDAFLLLVNMEAHRLDGVVSDSTDITTWAD